MFYLFIFKDLRSHWQVAFAEVFPFWMKPQSKRKSSAVSALIFLLPIPACQTMGTGMMLSSWATSSIEEVAEAGPEALRWMQLYIYKDREVSRQLVKWAEQMGYKAIFVTVDTPYLGNRFDDVRNRFKLPPQLR